MFDNSYKMRNKINILVLIIGNCNNNKKIYHHDCK